MANELNVFGNTQQGISAQSVTAAMATTRQAQEVQAAMVVAKNFPRNPRQSLDRILESCNRPTLAENATYEYARGGNKIYGPSIRLAECIAQSWGNIDFGFIELDRSKGESTVMAYAWDLETNTRQSRVFSVKHQRDTKDGSYALTEERDIYETIANHAARRIRACILALIPGDVIDAAMHQCEHLRNSASRPSSWRPSARSRAPTSSTKRTSKSCAAFIRALKTALSALIISPIGCRPLQRKTQLRPRNPPKRHPQNRRPPPPPRRKKSSHSRWAAWMIYEIRDHSERKRRKLHHN